MTEQRTVGFVGLGNMGGRMILQGFTLSNACTDAVSASASNPSVVSTIAVSRALSSSSVSGSIVASAAPLSPLRPEITTCAPCNASAQEIASPIPP